MNPIFDLGTMIRPNTANATTQITQIPCNMLVPYHNHKFSLYSGERLDDMIASIRANGVLTPIVVQPLNDGYEIIIGHNRWNASKLAGLSHIPAIIKTGLTEEEAEMYVIESNLMQRGFDDLKISEQAAVIAARHSKMFSQGKRNDIIKELQKLEDPETECSETSSPVGKKFATTSEKIGADYGMSKNTVARLIRIDKLIDGLKPLVDDGTIPIRAAVNLSYLPEDIQDMLISLLKKYKIDIKRSEILREQSSIKTLDQLSVIKILMGRSDRPEEIKSTKSIRISNATYSKYFDKKMSKEEISNTIEKALSLYFKNEV